MPFLKSLEICGFRSYSVDQPQFLKFKSPLTLILGKNGSGKTTILEVLRYSCSGQFPPNSAQGKTFLRDPFLDNAKNTLAQAELIFQSVYGQKIIAKRMAKLQKGKKESYKNMGQSLRTKNQQNQMVNIDQNLAQFDRTIPFLLGSNKEILENVILCHQEDQFWMFQDPTSLKKVFDSIFNSQNISKFIDISAKQVKLKQKQNILDSHEAKFSKLEYEQFMASKKDLLFQIEQLKQVKQKIKELNELISSHPDYQKINQIERQIGDINSKIQSNKQKLQVIESKIQELNFDQDIEIDEQDLNRQIQDKVNQKNFKKQRIEQIKHNQENLGVLVLQDQINTILVKLKFNIIEDQQFCDLQQLKEKQQLLTQNKELKDKEYQAINDEYQKLIQNKEEIINTYTDQLNILQQKQQKSKNLDMQRQAYSYKQKILNQQNIKTQLMIEEEQSDLNYQQLSEERDKNEEHLQLLKNTTILQLYKEKKANIKSICDKNNWSISNKNDVKIILDNIHIQINEQQKLQQDQLVELNMIKKSIQQKQIEQNDIIAQKNEITKLLQESQIEFSTEQNIIEEFLQMKDRIKSLTEQTICIQENIRYSQELLDQSSKQHQCQLCLQKLSEDNIPIVQLNLQQRNQYSKNSLQKIQQELEELQKKYNCTKGFKTKIQNFQKCLQQLQQISNDVQESIIQKKNINNNIVHAKQYQQQLVEKLNNLRNIEMQLFELEQQEQQINFQPEKVIQTDKSCQQLQQEINECSANLEHINNNVKRMKNQREMITQQIRQCQNKCISLQDNIIKLGYSVNDDIENPEDTIKEDYNQQIQSTQIAIDHQKIHFQEKINQVENQKIQNKVILSFYDDCLQKLEEYICKNKEHNSLQEKNEIYAEIEKLTDELIILTQQQNYIKLKIEKEQNIIESNQLQFTLQNYLDKKKVLNKGKKEYEELIAQINESQGRQKVFKQQIKLLVLNLKTQGKQKQDGSNIVYKAIQHNMRNEINQFVVQDATYLNKGLEKACINVNKEQIETINKTIRNIWKETYSSNDIQTIKIQSLPKKHNKTEMEYKILTIDKEGKQMDFKSKSSAGQKMLASIVIRLALAELYSEQCGIFALDEPTTNLDKDNIILLANFLKRLVDLKKTDEDFQLIIITHDEKFLSQMHGLIDSYFEVQKNKNGHSQLREMKVQMNFVMNQIKKYQKNYKASQAWEFLEIRDIKEDLQEEECLSTRKRECTKVVDQWLTLNLVKKELRSQESKVVTINSELLDQTPVIITGNLKESPLRLKFLMLFTTPVTMNWSELIHQSKTLLLELMLLHLKIISLKDIMELTKKKLKVKLQI